MAILPRDITVVTNINLLTYHTKVVDLTWKERLKLRWPWRPWIKTKVVNYTKPDRNVYFYNDFFTKKKMMAVHPTVFTELKTKIQEAPNEIHSNFEWRPRETCFPRGS